MSKLRKSGALSKGKRLKGGAVLAIVIVAAVAIGVAFASTTVKKFEATIEQTGPSAFRLTLTNDRTSNQTFGSANIEVPSGFSTPTALLQTVAGGSKRWLTPFVNTSVSPRRIELRSPDSKNALAAGESLTLVFTATAPCSPQSYDWPTYVKQSNSFLGTGNDFVGNVPSVSVTDGLATFAITRIGHPQLVGRSFGVSVEAKDACGNTLPTYQGPATVHGLSGVGSSSLAFASGRASTTLTPVDPQVAAQVTVADGGISNSSNEFDVVTRFCTSEDEAEACEASDADNTITVVTPRPPVGATMALSFGGRGTTLTCGDGSGATRGALATVDPVGYTDPIPMSTRWDKSVAPGTGVANFVFCMSKDGVSYVVVPPCTKAGGLPPPPNEFFCELKRNRNGVGDLVIQYLIAPEDPWVGVR